MKFNPRFWLRKLHRWGSILIALPFLLVILTGLLLQLKKEIAWVQPPSKRGTAMGPALTFEQILRVMQSVPEAEVRSWNDIDRLDVRPDRALIKVQCKNSWEVQLDAQEGKVLQIAYRRSDLIESLHDGSWFGEPIKLWIFLPAAGIVLGLWLTGMYLFFLPLVVKWRRKKRPDPPLAA